MQRNKNISKMAVEVLIVTMQCCQSGKVSKVLMPSIQLRRKKHQTMAVCKRSSDEDSQQVHLQGQVVFFSFR
jgi:hypothetical protein